jgi:o-succinylbenzoate synthase
MRRRFVPYALAFRRPVVTSAGTWAVRRGAWLVAESDEGRIGLGEVAPLEPFASPEALATALEAPGLREAANELAELDLEGQRTGRPVALLLGERPRAQVPVNALLFETGEEELAEEASRAVGEGFRTVKIKVGATDPERDIRRITLVRARVGPSVAMRLDANGAWDEATAIRVLRAVAGCGIEYVEDPVAGDPRGVRAKAGVAVAIDVPSVADGWRAVRAKSADVLVLKPMAMGGVLAVRPLACAAIEAGIGVVVTSVFDTAGGVAGALHLAASLPGPERAHGLATVSLLEDAPLAGLALPQAGRLHLPAGPGLGVRLHEVAR